MSFHEKSAWACLLAIVLVFVPYFLVAFQTPTAMAGLFVLAVIGLVILLTLYHLANAILTRSIRETGDTPPMDELDRMIELRAAKLSGIVLASAVLIWCMVASVGAPAMGVVEVAAQDAANAEVTAADFSIPVTRAMWAIQLLFAGFVIANVVYYGSIIFGYRRLALG